MVKKVLFEGSCVALVTPMFEDGKINYKKLYELIDFHVDSQTDAIVVAGTTGEASTLTNEEYITLLQRTVSHANSRIPVIAGAGSNCTAQAIWKSQQAKMAGVDGVLIVTPYYNKTSQEGIVKHYLSIAESVDLPIVLYNVPGRTGLSIAPETYQKLASHPNIVATKEASGNFSNIAKTICLCGDNLCVYSGNDDQIVPLLALGGKGVVSVAANIVPKEIHEMCRLFFENKITQSLKLQLKFLALINELFSTINPMPIKCAMNFLGYDVGRCRLPLVSPDEHLVADLKNILSLYFDF